MLLPQVSAISSINMHRYGQHPRRSLELKGGSTLDTLCYIMYSGPADTTVSGYGAATATAAAATV
jgi:hypothetical protein